MSIQAPIGKLMLLSEENPEMLGNPQLISEISAFISTIKNITKQNGIAEPPEIIKGTLYKLRLELIVHFLNKPDKITHIENKILEEISNYYSVTGPHESIAKIVSDSLEVYYKLFSHFSLTLPIPQNLNQKGINPKFPSYEELKNSLIFDPFPGSSILILWMESSLKFDYSLIISDLLIDGTLQLDHAEEDAAKEHLKQAIIDFSSSAAAAHLWNIPSGKFPFSDEIKIRTLELTVNTDNFMKTKAARNFSGVWSKEDAESIEKIIREGTDQIDIDGWE